MSKFGAIAVAGIFGLTTAQAAVIDFEGLAAGTIVDDDIEGVTISANGWGSSPDVAVIFDTDNPTGGDVDLGAPFMNPQDMESGEFFPGNVLIIQENGPCGADACEVPDDNAPGGKITIVFDLPVILHSLDFFDIESGESNDDGINAFDMVIMADNGGPMPIGTWGVPATGGDNTWGSVDLDDVFGVRQLDIVLFGSGAIDNIRFTVIPVPAAAWFFGSALLGLMGFRRRLRT
ncbi:MAG: VPLPA-CTERM sorting domain-containing protein [Gammaproteobacteria bacterium]|nr:VPLPA-CTERM sorting domain-containing protein [Gammaproteobacteria bacterium]